MNLRYSANTALAVVVGVCAWSSPLLAQTPPDDDAGATPPTDAEGSAPAEPTDPEASPPPDAPPASEAPAQPPKAAAAEPPVGDAAEPRAATASAEAAATEEIASLEKRLADLEKAKEDAEIAALTAGGDEEIAAKVDPLRIYGFFDVGAQKIWADTTTPVANYLPGTNAATFVIGNLNLYFDAQPVPDWRGLLEVRFTNAPHGNVVSPGGFGFTFERENTQQIDPHATAANAPMWGGRTVIERAWIEWNHFQQMKVRVGNFFTPWGIWNIDHGTPTLLGLALPQFILQQAIPIRQTGIQILGTTFAGNWELGYQAYLTNGRQEISNFDFDDDKAGGLRLTAKYQGDGFMARFGASGYAGNYENEEVEITAVDPLTFEKKTTAKTTEHLVGLDLSVDIGDSARIRTEGMVRERLRGEGQLPSGNPVLSPPGAFNGGGYEYYWYVMYGHRLPWAGLEPFAQVEFNRINSTVGEDLLVPSLGLNVHISAAVKIKAQYSHAFFFDPNDELTDDVSRNDVDTLYGRLVIAF